MYTVLSFESAELSEYCWRNDKLPRRAPIWVWWLILLIAVNLTGLSDVQIVGFKKVTVSRCVYKTVSEEISIWISNQYNSLQYSCLENPRDRGAWWAAVYGVAQSWTRLKRLSSSSSSRASNEDHPHQYRWASSNTLRAWIEPKDRERVNWFSLLQLRYSSSPALQHWGS